MEGVTYPPAAAAEGTVGFWQGFASPSNFVEMVQATWDHSAAEFGTWFERSTEAGDGASPRCTSTSSTSSSK